MGASLSSPRGDNRVEAVPRQAPCLPLDILVLIAGHMSSAKELQALTRTSKSMHDSRTCDALVLSWFMHHPRARDLYGVLKCCGTECVPSLLRISPERASSMLNYTMCMASVADDLHHVQWAMERGADPSFHNHEALLRACANGSANCVAHLVGTGSGMGTGAGTTPCFELAMTIALHQAHHHIAYILHAHGAAYPSPLHVKRLKHVDLNALYDAYNERCKRALSSVAA